MDELAELSVDELEERLRGVMAERSLAEQGFKEHQRAITAELDRRAATARVTAALDGLAPDVRIAVLETLKAGG